MPIAPAQNRRINDARILGENCRTAVHNLLDELTGDHYDRSNAAVVDALNEAKSKASGARMALHRAVDLDALQQQPSPSILTEREQQAIDNINKVLNDDGSDPDYNPGGAWDDCGEVDVPILLELVARLTK